MLRALLKAAPVSLLVAGALAAPAPAALQTVLQDDPGLLHRTPEQITANAQRMAALGVDRVRITAGWSLLTRAPEGEEKPAFDPRDPAAYEQARWASLDRAIRAVHAAGMGVQIDIGFWAPHWATSDKPGPRARTNIDPRAYADFAVAVARRYSGGFTPVYGAPVAPTEDQELLDEIFGPVLPAPLAEALGTGRQAPAAAAAQAEAPLPPVDQYILWNEPNIPALLLPQWKGNTPASPAIYRAMVYAAYPAVKGVRDGLSVLIGNTSSTGGRRGSGAVAPLEFVRELACVNSSLRPRGTAACRGYRKLPGDGWAHHPYSQNERPTRRSSPRSERGDVRIADLPELATTLRRLAAKGRIASANRNIHLTEFGYETGRIPGRPSISAATQARWLTWAESIADRVPTVRSWAQFLLRDQAPAPVRVTSSRGRPGGEFYTGLLTADGKDKPAARQFRAGLFAQRSRGGRKVSLYGRLRLGAGPKRIEVQRRLRGGRWQLSLRLTVDGRDSFRRTVTYRSGARYRLRYPDGARTASSLDVPVVAATR